MANILTFKGFILVFVFVVSIISPSLARHSKVPCEEKYKIINTDNDFLRLVQTQSFKGDVLLSNLLISINTHIPKSILEIIMMENQTVTLSEILKLNQTSNRFLQEMTNRVHRVFEKAYTNMNDIQGYIGNLPRFIKNVMQYLASNNNKAMTLQIPVTLKKIKDSDTKCQELSREIVEEFQKVSELLQQRIDDVKNTKPADEKGREMKRKYLLAHLALERHWDSIILFFDRFDFLIKFISSPQVEDLNKFIKIMSTNPTVALNNAGMLQEVLDRIQSTNLALNVIDGFTKMYLDASNLSVTNKAARLNTIISNMTSNNDKKQVKRELIDLYSNIDSFADFMANEENTAIMHHIVSRHKEMKEEYRAMFLCPKDSTSKNDDELFVFQIKSQLNEKVLEVTTTVEIQMWDQKYEDFDDQLWYIDKQNVIRSFQTAFCLTSHGPYPSVITSEPCNYRNPTKRNQQKWTLRENKIVHIDSPDLCLEIHSSDTYNGASIVQSKCRDDPNQLWDVYIQ